MPDVERHSINYWKGNCAKVVHFHSEAEQFFLEREAMTLPPLINQPFFLFLLFYPKKLCYYLYVIHILNGELYGFLMTEANVMGQVAKMNFFDKVFVCSS